VGFGCGWAKLNVVQFGSARAVACSFFNFAKGWHFVEQFQHECLMLDVRTSLAGNGPALGGVRDKLSQMYIWKRKVPSNLIFLGTKDARMLLSAC
jgi:hypothetical protein